MACWPQQFLLGRLSYFYSGLIPRPDCVHRNGGDRNNCDLSSRNTLALRPRQTRNACEAGRPNYNTAIFSNPVSVSGTKCICPFRVLRRRTGPSRWGRTGHAPQTAKPVIRVFMDGTPERLVRLLKEIRSSGMVTNFIWSLGVRPCARDRAGHQDVSFRRVPKVGIQWVYLRFQRRNMMPVCLYNCF